MHGPVQSSGIPAATTTDLLKVVGVASFLVDHWGLFVAGDEPWMRVAGRVAAPIFFFLVGYARTRQVPRSWIVAGILLTACLSVVGLTAINILIAFAVLRAFVLPAAASLSNGRPWLLLALALACAPLVDLTDRYMEYGTQGWMWAFLGLACRQAGDGGAPRWLAPALALVAAAATFHNETGDLGLQGGLVVVLGAILAVEAVALLLFRRADLPARLPGPVRVVLRMGGRHSLAIYAVTLVALLAAFVLSRA